jgi:hypothetical protein
MITGDPQLNFVQLGNISTGIFKYLRFFFEPQRTWPDAGMGDRGGIQTRQEFTFLL